MRPILPKLPTERFQNKTLTKNNFLSHIYKTPRLTKSKSCKISSTSIKNNNSLLLNCSTNSIKLLRLKNLISDKKNSSNDKSIRQDFLSLMKKEQIFLSKNSSSSQTKNIKEIKENSNNNINNNINNNNEFFLKTFRQYYPKNYKEYLNNNINPKNINVNFNNTMINKNINKTKNKNGNIIQSNSLTKIKLNRKKYSNVHSKILPIDIRFDKEDIFIKYIIEKFVDNNNNILPKDNKHRIIYIILNGSMIINYNKIQGHFINILTKKEFKKLSKEKRAKYMKNLLITFQNIFELKKPIKSIFSPDKKLILDLLEIKKEYKYIYISNSIICKGISILTTPNLVDLYNTEFLHYLNQKAINLSKNKNEINIKKYKISKISFGIKEKKEILKPHYSFSSGENEIETNNYIYYSDDEERKNKACKEIEDNCLFKNDFYIYINEKRINEKIKNLKTKLNFKKHFNLKESYDNYHISFDKLINRYKKELSKKLGIKPMIFKSEIDKNKDYDFEDMDHQFNKLYLKRQSSKDQLNKKLNKNYYYNVDRNVAKYYAYFILYNIPKLLAEYKNYTRKRLFEIFTQFKDLMALSFSLNKNEFILKNGIDFNTFWNCIEELTDERENFAKKLFSQVNKSNSSLLNIEDFIKGMYFIKNSEITEKLELFLKSLDISGKGEINYKEAIEISKESILRNLIELNTNEENDIILNDLSTFFANFIFKLVGVEKDKSIKISDLKKAIIEGNNENNGVEYLEMFCGANKTK